jgi:hypothetical protein
MSCTRDPLARHKSEWWPWRHPNELREEFCGDSFIRACGRTESYLA